MSSTSPYARGSTKAKAPLHCSVERGFYYDYE
jgi:hypothetical protein